MTRHIFIVCCRSRHANHHLGANIVALPFLCTFYKRSITRICHSIIIIGRTKGKRGTRRWLGDHTLLLGESLCNLITKQIQIIACHTSFISLSTVYVSPPANTSTYLSFRAAKRVSAVTWITSKAFGSFRTTEARAWHFVVFEKALFSVSYKCM